VGWQGSTAAAILLNPVRPGPGRLALKIVQLGCYPLDSASQSSNRSAVGESKRSTGGLGDVVFVSTLHDAPLGPVMTDPGSDFATPPGRPGGFGILLTLRRLPYLAAWIAIGLARLFGRPFRIGSKIIVARHADVTEVLGRDLDFRLRPINGPKFDQIGFHFILGMDRSAELIAERRALYTALAKVDGAALQAAAKQDIAHTLSGATGGVDVVEGYARPIAAATASRLFGIAPADRAAFMDAARAIFGNSFLNVSGDKAMTDRALAAASALSDWFDAEIARRHAAHIFGSDMMGSLLAAGASDDLTRRTLGGMLVGSIDTTATCVAKVISVLMRDRRLLARVSADTNNLDLMWGWCNEALRRWAHGPLLLRKAACDTSLGGVDVKAGDDMLLLTQAAMFDEAAFPVPRAMRPDRPLAPYLHFGGGLHPCAGRGVNAWQIPLLVAGLLDRNPTGLKRMVWAGPFPAHLPITFQE
jgi:cytochrome P450